MFYVTEIDKEIDLDLKLFGMKLYLLTNAKLKNKTVYLSAEVKLCTGLFATCLPPIDLFHNIKFDLGTSCRRKRCKILFFP